MKNSYIIFVMFLMHISNLNASSWIDKLPIYDDISKVELVKVDNHFKKFVLISDLERYSLLDTKYTIVRCVVEIDTNKNFVIRKIQMFKYLRDIDPNKSIRDGYIFSACWFGATLGGYHFYCSKDEWEKECQIIFEEQKNNVLRLIDKYGIDFFIGNIDPWTNQYLTYIDYIIKNKDS